MFQQISSESAKKKERRTLIIFCFSQGKTSASGNPEEKQLNGNVEGESGSPVSKVEDVLIKVRRYSIFNVRCQGLKHLIR